MGHNDELPEKVLDKSEQVCSLCMCFCGACVIRTGEERHGVIPSSLAP